MRHCKVAFGIGVLMLSMFSTTVISATESNAEIVVPVPEGLIRHEANDPPNLVGKNLKEPQALAAGQYESPQQMYQTSCAQCHEIGVGAARTLLGRSLGVNYIMFWMRNGRGGGGMPTFKPTDYSDSDVQQLAKWIVEQPKLAELQGGAQ